MMAEAGAPPALSIIHGPPLAEEAGLGSLTLAALIREVTGRYADREALVMHEPDGAVVRWSYAELWARSVEVARALLACGLAKGERVGVLMTNRQEWLSATFGTALAGGLPVGLSTFSTPPELDHLLRASAVSIVLFEKSVLKRDFAAMLIELEPKIAASRPGELQSLAYPFLRRLAGVGVAQSEGAIESWADFRAHAAEVPAGLVDATAAAVHPSDPGLLFFSSGSTNKPKGILNANRGVCIQLWRWRRIFGLDEDVRCWSANGFFWSGNFSQALGAAFSTGGSLVLQQAFSPAQSLRLMEAERVTLPIAWPHQWKQLEDAPNFADADLSALKYIDPNNPVGRHPSVKSDWMEPVWAYGNTETFTLSTIFAAGTPRERSLNSHGEALPGNTLRIVDPITGATTPLGERGEIAVKGPTLMLGYIGIPLDETLDEDGFFRTGDAGRVDGEGRLFWEGRLTDIIKTGGANVSPLEIDEVINAFPGVKRSQTVGVPHETLGELVVACVIPYEGVSLDEQAIREFARTKLASYKTPRRVLFFREEELAQTGSAKIKSSELRKLAASRLQPA